MNTSPVHRWPADGFIAGEQVTPGPPWQIRITEELRSRIIQEAPPEYLPMLEATLKLGVSRPTVLQRNLGNSAAVGSRTIQQLICPQRIREGLRWQECS
jgi:hypothetical protein